MDLLNVVRYLPGSAFALWMMGSNLIILWLLLRVHLGAQRDFLPLVVYGPHAVRLLHAAPLPVRGTRPPVRAQGQQHPGHASLDVRPIRR